MGQFKPMVKMETTEPSAILKLKSGGSVHTTMKHTAPKDPGYEVYKKGGMAKKATGGVMMSPAPAAAPMADSGNMVKRAMMQRAMQKKRPGAPMMAAEMAGPAMKEGGKADMAQDKAMIKKAMKQHDRQEHKGGKGTELSLKKGGRMAC